MIDLTLFVPCFNEEKNIAGALHEIDQALSQLTLKWEVIVVDDCSRDNTVAEVKAFMASRSDLPIRLLESEHNQGLAANYVRAASIAEGRYFRLVCGDNVETAETLRSVFRQVGSADMILFYHSADSSRSPIRVAISHVFTFLVNLISGYRIKYYNGGALHLTKNVLRWPMNKYGFAYQAEVIIRLLDEGASYTEVPISAQERPAGRSNAFSSRNIRSVANFFIDLMMRRLHRLFMSREVPSAKSF